MTKRSIPEEATVDQAPETNWVGALTILTGKRAGRCIAVDKDTFTIGRSRGCDLVLDDKEVSRRHAEVRFKDGAYTLKDLGSRWGTRVGGQKVTESLLRYGDEFEVAGVLLQFDMSLKSELTPKKISATKVVIFAAVFVAIAAAVTLFYFKGNVKKNLDRPGGDVLSQIIYHYDKGINYYNRLDRGNAEDVDLVIEEMQKVIELDPEAKTRFSRSARRIIDGLEK